MNITDSQGTTWDIITADLLAHRLRLLADDAPRPFVRLSATVTLDRGVDDAEWYEPTGTLLAAATAEPVEGSTFAPGIEIGMDDEGGTFYEFTVDPDTVVLLRTGTAAKAAPGLSITCPPADLRDYVQHVAAEIDQGFTSGHVDAEHHWTTR